MDEQMHSQLKPGTRVKVTQQIAHRDPSRVLVREVEGMIEKYSQRQTGSWFAHSRDDKLWLDRLQLRKANGELTTLNLDDYSHIEILQPQVA
jgi:hypothetical protein